MATSEPPAPKKLLGRNLTVADYQALADFRYQIRRFVRFSEEAARHAGLEPQHHQLMLAVKGKPKGEHARIAFLAERLQIQHHSAVELVDRMVNKGLITRERGEADRREVHVQLTERGDQILGQLTMNTRAELRSAAPALSASLRRLTGVRVPTGAPKNRRKATTATTARRSK